VTNTSEQPQMFTFLSTQTITKLLCLHCRHHLRLYLLQTLPLQAQLVELFSAVILLVLSVLPHDVFFQVRCWSPVWQAGSPCPQWSQLLEWNAATCHYIYCVHRLQTLSRTNNCWSIYTSKTKKTWTLCTKICKISET